MSRTITYDGMEFTFTKMNVRETLLYDTDDRTLLGTRYEFNIGGYLIGDDGIVEDFADKMRDFRRTVMKPRKEFIVRDSGSTFFRYDPESEHGWGPKPQSVYFTEFAAMKAVRFQWSLQVFVRECANVDLTHTSGIIGLTKTYSFSVDIAGLTTRSINGTLKTTSTDGPADKYRFLMIPPLPRNYRRIQQQFSQSSDMRTVTFNIVDQEVIRTLPTNIAEGEATWSVRLGDFGFRVYYTLTGRFRGSRNTPKTQLMGRIAELSDARFPINEPDLIFEDVSVDDAIYDNELSFNIVASGVVGINRAGNPDLNSVFRRMSLSPPSSDGNAFLAGPYGDVPSSGSRAKEVPIRDFCAGTTPLPDTNIVEVGGAVLREEAPIQPLDFIDTVERGGVSFEHVSTPYVAFHERIAYEYDNNIVVFEPEMEGEHPIFQQTSEPGLIITQSGYQAVYSTSGANVPQVPQPRIADATLLHMSVTPQNPEPVTAGGVALYTTHWVYVMRHNSAVLNTTELSERMKYPLDRRTSEPEDLVLFKPDELGFTGLPDA